MTETREQMIRDLAQIERDRLAQQIDCDLQLLQAKVDQLLKREDA